MTSTERATRTVPPAPTRPGEQRAPTYRLPKTPPAAWSPAGCRRRTWVSRAVLLLLLALQSALSLRLSNTAFQDEALYLTAGHAELAHLLQGTPSAVDYAAYFSGSPHLYPVLAAAVDSRFGLSGARTLSLLFMLGTTGLLYSFTRRLFNERAGLAAAALFAVMQSTVVMGYFATHDAPALFLLALATWIIVRTDRAPATAVLVAVPVAVLAVGVKYAAGLYLPTLVGLALLTAWPHQGAKAIARALLLALGTAGLLALGMHGTDLLAGVRRTTTHRDHGSDGAGFLLWQSAQWGGLMFLTAVGGAISYVRRSRMGESPLTWRLRDPSRRTRVLLGSLLCTTALFAPAYQVHLGTMVSLFKHIGYGLLFAAPLAGVGLTRLVGAHFRHPHLGIALWAAALCLGIAQADGRFGSWPDSSRMIRTISSDVNGNGHYLSSTPEVPAYYLRERTAHWQWRSVFGMAYTDRNHIRHTGDAAYRAALRDGEFDLIVLDGFTNPQVDRVISRALKGNPHYRLLAHLPFGNPSHDRADSLLRSALFSEYGGRYRIWVKQ
ncbi:MULTISPECIES: glycosyltransferase family 39 protein [unclassified Streptomyces]|uniref:glycosyltransferase family 39 protein n=1 Tax=unclassified Streptomyces TaxID=2593676 RepID=UPI002E2C0257|nr:MULTISPECIES: glycosyltransferase family 39 protein [unclassified Streptomyces]